jgi:ParB family chromosome partitioning protein
MVKEATPQASLEMALVENIQRRDLNPLEEAHAFRQLIEEHGLTQEQLGQRIGKSRVAVSNSLRLLHLPEPVREALARTSISEGHARAILMANGEAQQRRLLERVLAGHLSVRETEALARETNAARQRASQVLPDPDVERLEDEFRQALGTRVRLVKGRRGGRLVIHFFSEDELQGLYQAIVRR